jgi:predicted RNA-binding protein with PUA-like domain
MNYWLLKSEGDCYSIDDLKRDKKTSWTGVRNYQARNFMRDGMQSGDLVLFYHSNGTTTAPTGIYGIAKIGKIHPDETQFDKVSEYYDPKAILEKPTWFCPDITFVKKFPHPVTLTEIKFDPRLSGMIVAQKGSRLSVQPVSERHFKIIEALSLEK